MKFSEKLKELRIKKGLTQESLAEKLNISRQSISKWEQGINEPNIQTLKELCLIFQVSIDELVDDDKEVVLSIDEKNKKKTYILFWAQIAIALASVLNIFMLTCFMDDIVPIHFDSHFKADSYGPKWFYLLTIVFVLLFVGISCFHRYFLIKKSKEYEKHQVGSHTLFLILQIIIGLLTVIPLFFLIDFIDSLYSIFLCEISIVIMVLSFFSSPLFNKNPNFIFGYRTTFSMSSKQRWIKLNTIQCISAFILSFISFILGLIFSTYYVMFFVGLTIFSVIPTFIAEIILKRKDLSK